MQVITYTATGSGALSLSCSPLGPSGSWRLLNISVKGASSVATAFVATLDASQGTAYDTILNSTTNWTDLFIEGGDEMIFKNGDKMLVSCGDAVVVKSVVVRVELL